MVHNFESKDDSTITTSYKENGFTYEILISFMHDIKWSTILINSWIYVKNEVGCIHKCLMLGGQILGLLKYP